MSGVAQPKHWCSWDRSRLPGEVRAAAMQCPHLCSVTTCKTGCCLLVHRSRTLRGVCDLLWVRG